jgi:DNA-binding GntR family transcriptional regulator
MRTANQDFAAALRANRVDDALAADDAFHAVAVDSCANPAVRAVLEQYGPVLRRVERLRFSSLTGRASVAQHEKIIQLCAAGDVDAAGAAARANWQTLAPLLEAAGTTDSGTATDSSR